MEWLWGSRKPTQQPTFQPTFQPTNFYTSQNFVDDVFSILVLLLVFCCCWFVILCIKAIISGRHAKPSLASSQKLNYYGTSHDFEAQISKSINNNQNNNGTNYKVHSGNFTPKVVVTLTAPQQQAKDESNTRLASQQNKLPHYVPVRSVVGSEAEDGSEDGSELDLTQKPILVETNKKKVYIYKLQAENFKKEENELYKKAKNKRNPGQKRQDYYERAKEAGKKYAETMFKAMNIRLNDSTIDLHGQTKEYALKFLEEELNSKTKETLSVIVGKGNNSCNGPVLGPAVEEWLRSNNYTFGYDPRNSGRIIVDT